MKITEQEKDVSRHQKPNIPVDWLHVRNWTCNSNHCTSQNKLWL